MILVEFRCYALGDRIIGAVRGRSRDGGGNKVTGFIRFCALGGVFIGNLKPPLNLYCLLCPGTRLTASSCHDMLSSTIVLEFGNVERLLVPGRIKPEAPLAMVSTGRLHATHDTLPSIVDDPACLVKRTRIWVRNRQLQL